MERLGDKLDQVKLDRSSQARFAPYQQLHLGACLGEAAFLVVRLPIRLTGLQARRTEPSHPEPPHCREAAQRASENSFALLEGTQKIALITPGSVTARKHVQCTKSQGMQWSGCGLHLYDNTTLHFKPRKMMPIHTTTAFLIVPNTCRANQTHLKSMICCHHQHQIMMLANHQTTDLKFS
ncbi:TPA: hypothetical protein ACH3X1_003083 [Trebouxia sp. C0004]